MRGSCDAGDRRRPLVLARAWVAEEGTYGVVELRGFVLDDTEVEPSRSTLAARLRCDPLLFFLLNR